MIPTFFAFVYFLPPELSFLLGGSSIELYRIFLIGLTPGALLWLLSGGVGRLKTVDYGYIAISTLQVASFLYNAPDIAGIPSAGIAFLENLGCYAIARRYLATPEAIDRFVWTWLILLGFLLPVLYLEAISHQFIVHTLASTLTGGGAHSSFGSHREDVARETRLGLLRAMGPFPHPILCGIAYAVFLSFVLARMRGGKRIWCSLLCLAGVVPTLSSNAILVVAVELVIFGGLSMLGRRPWKNPIQTILLILVPIYLYLEAFSSRSVANILMSSLALDSWSGYYRILIWQYGWQDVLNNPVFGLGYHDWPRAPWMVADSTDSYWLTLGIENGLIVFILVIAVALITFVQVLVRYCEHPVQSEEVRELSRAWLAAFFAICITAFAVDFWGIMMMLFPMLVGIGMNLADALRVPAKARSPLARRFRLPIRRPAAASPRVADQLQRG